MFFCVQVRYAKSPAPACSEQEEEEPSSRKRVTRGRQVCYLETALLSEEEESKEEDEEEVSRQEFVVC